jgi:hypothetical protein
MRANELLKESELDPRGWGSTPFGVDIDYFGLRVQMRPSTFLKLAAPLEQSNTNPEVEKHMRGGGKIAPPMLDIEIPDDWSHDNFSESARVVGHEGRNRMAAWIKLKGDDPIQVNIKPRGSYRRRNLTTKHIEAISKGLLSQRGNLVSGPLFSVESVLEEKILNEIDVAPSDAHDPSADSKYYSIKGPLSPSLHSVKPIPWMPEYSYYIKKYNSDNVKVTIIDSNNQSDYAGQLLLVGSVNHPKKPEKDILQSSVTTVHPNYRNKGIGTSLYRLALLPKPIGGGFTIMSDDYQTPGGIATWHSLSKLSDIEITGLVMVMKPATTTTSRIKLYDSLIRDLFGKIGGVYLSETEMAYWYEIPVKAINGRMENRLKTSLIRIYDSSSQPLRDVVGTFLMAKYAG